MTDDVDIELRDRLAALSAAVPVAAAAPLGRAVSPRVRAGSASRRPAPGSLVPLVAIVVVGAVIAGVAGLGPFAPNGSGNGPVVATVTDGAFELTIRSPKARYLESEPIQISAELTYRGGSATLEISHAQGAHGGPLGFGIEEPVIGDLRLAPNWAESCERSTLADGTPLTAAFQKGGSWSGGHARADEYRAYMADPILRLTEGTWHVFAVAEFSLGDCGGEAHRMRADLAIDVVVEQPSSAPTEPTDDGPVVATASDGLLQLAIELPQLSYREGEVIEPVGRLMYIGSAAGITTYHGAPPLPWSIAEVDGTRTTGGAIDLLCASTALVAGEPLVMPYEKGGAVADDPSQGFTREWFDDPELRLPPGKWRISVTSAIATGGCGGESHEMTASLEVTVDAATAPPVEPRACLPDEIALLAGPTEGVSGEVLAFVVVASTGTESCRLVDTQTRAKLVSPTDGFIAQAVGTFRLGGGGSAFVDLDPRLSPLLPDGARPGQGVVSVFVGNGCWRDPNATLWVWLAAAPGEAVMPIGLGRCDDPEKPVRLRLGFVEAAP